MLTTKHRVVFGSRSKPKTKRSDDAATAEAKIPRVAKMMALAIRFDHLIRSGQVKDQSDVATLGQVSRARLSQIMCLNCLAPDIQEEILTMECSGSSFPTERSVRRIASAHSWTKQRLMWTELKR